MSRFHTGLTLLAVSALCACHAQTIEVAPDTVMVDETAAVVVAHAVPGAQVTISAALTDGDGHPWVSEADFTADARGIVDTAKLAPVRGSYRIVSASGLIWSMRPAEKNVHIYVPPHGLGSQTIQFRLVLEGKEVSSTELQQMFIRPDVQQIKVDGALHGTLFVPGTLGKHPAVLVVGGSEGGEPGGRAAWLASHGYVTLALCYFHCEGTPPKLERVPLEYFGEALGWMAQRPEVDSSRMGVMGTSRGGELALQIGSMYSEIKAVVAYVPANVRYPSCCDQRPGPSWTWHGQPLGWAAPWLNPSAPLNAAIAVEHTNGSILMIGGKDDDVWPSSEMVDAAAARLRAAHFAYPVVLLQYDHAGHRAGLPEIIPEWSEGVTQRISGRATNFGGSPEGNALSSLDAIPKVLDFLAQNLATSPSAK